MSIFFKWDNPFFFFLAIVDFTLEVLTLDVFRDLKCILLMKTDGGATKL